MRFALVSMMLGAATIGTTGILVRYADVPPTVSAFWRMLFGGLLLGLILRLSGRWQPLSRRVLLWCLVPGAAFAADLFLWHRSILLVGPGLATVLANAQVFFMALAGFFLFGERIGVRLTIGVILAFIGLWLMLGRGWSQLADGYQYGVFLGLATGVCYACYNLGFKRAQKAAAPVSSEMVLMALSLFSAALLGLTAVVENVSFSIPNTRSLIALVTLGFVGQCLGWVLIGRALPWLSVGLVGLLLLLQPTVAFLLDILLFARKTQPIEWLGLAFTLAGIFVAGLPKRKPVATIETGGS